jgi:hypothetical protein
MTAMNSRILSLTLAAALPLLVACKPQQEVAKYDQNQPPTQTSEKEIPGTNNPNDVSPVQAQSMIDDVTIGHKAEADGTIAAENQGDDFAPGDPVVLAMKVGDAPAGTTVKVDWYGPNDTKLDQTEKGINAGQAFLVFENPNTSGWKKGDYRAEVWVGDEKVSSQNFNIVDKKEARG